LDAIVIVIPVRIVRVVGIIPSLVIAIVVPFRVFVRVMATVAAVFIATIVFVVAGVFVAAIVFISALFPVIVLGRYESGRAKGHDENQARKHGTSKKSPAHVLFSPSGSDLLPVKSHRLSRIGRVLGTG
jgi:fatty acid desaturase